MGRTSSNARIPKDRAHLHFEMGVQLSSTYFNSWYHQQKFPVPNQHGNWNGFNLVGFDPLDYCKQATAHRFSSISGYIKSEPTAFCLRVITKNIPDFVRRYPSLLSKQFQGNIRGWDIEFTWYGLPKLWTPLFETDCPNLKEGTILLLKYDAEIFKTKGNRKTIIKKNNKALTLGKNLKRFLCILLNLSEKQLHPSLKL